MRTESRSLTFFLASIAALTSLSIDMSLPAIPAIEHNFGLTAGHGVLTLSFFLAGYAVTPLIGGPLADRFGRRPTLISSLGLFGFSALVSSVSPSYAVLLLFRLLQGCAAGIATTMPLAIIRDLLAGHTARERVSEMTTINSIMPIIAPIFGSAIMLLGSWRVVFAGQAIVAMAIVAITLLRLKESLPEERRQAIRPHILARNYRSLFANPVFLSYAVIYALTFACMFSFVSASPLILMQGMGLSRSAFTSLFSLIATGTVLGSFTSGLLNWRKTPVRVVVFAGLTIMTIGSSTATAFQIAHLRGPAAILPFMFLTFFGFGLTAPSVMIEALEPVPHLAGSASGLLHLILRLFGSGASGILGAYCARHFQRAELATTLAMTSAAVCASGLFLLRLKGSSTAIVVLGAATSNRTIAE